MAQYQVRMNGKYMNTYALYGEAIDEQQRLQKKFPTSSVIVEEVI